MSTTPEQPQTDPEEYPFESLEDLRSYLEQVRAHIDTTSLCASIVMVVVALPLMLFPLFQVPYVLTWLPSFLTPDSAYAISWILSIILSAGVAWGMFRRLPQKPSRFCPDCGREVHPGLDNVLQIQCCRKCHRRLLPPEQDLEKSLPHDHRLSISLDELRSFARFSSQLRACVCTLFALSGVVVCYACEASLAYAEVALSSGMSSFLVLAYLVVIVGVWRLMRYFLVPYLNYRRTCPCCTKSFWFPEPVLMSTGRCPNCGEKIFFGKHRYCIATKSLMTNARVRKVSLKNWMWELTPLVLFFCTMVALAMWTKDLFGELVQKSHSLPQISWEIVPVEVRLGFVIGTSILLFPVMVTMFVFLSLSKIFPSLDVPQLPHCIRCHSALCGSLEFKFLLLTGNCPGCGSPVIQDPLVSDFQPLPTAITDADH